MDCPRGCTEPVIVQIGKKKKFTSKPIKMREGMILNTCPKCSFTCRPYAPGVNESPQSFEEPARVKYQKSLNVYIS